MTDRDKCRSCGATIWWAITAKNRRMPLDPPGTHPDPNVSAWRDTLGILRVGPAEDSTAYVVETTSHFATCPEADKHRRR